MHLIGQCAQWGRVEEWLQLEGKFQYGYKYITPAHFIQNLDEIRTIIHLVRYYYRTRDFCVITPYDAQRAAIERALKAESLPWERVFNVDSFQGHVL